MKKWAISQTAKQRTSCNSSENRYVDSTSSDTLLLYIQILKGALWLIHCIVSHCLPSMFAVRSLHGCALRSLTSSLEGTQFFQSARKHDSERCRCMVAVRENSGFLLVGFQPQLGVRCTSILHVRSEHSTTISDGIGEELPREGYSLFGRVLADELSTSIILKPTHPRT